MFFDTEAAVVISVRWQATDFPLAYLTFAVLAMLDKRPEFQLRKTLVTHGARPMTLYLPAYDTILYLNLKVPLPTPTDLHI